MSFDLNCDLGEGEPFQKTAALMRHVTSASIACGGHAGDGASISRCLELAKQFGVHAGAHPGIKAGFGRGAGTITVADFEKLLCEQSARFEQLARDQGVPFHHVKLHGTLYHLVEEQRELRTCYVEFMRRRYPGVVLFGRAGGALAREARTSGIEIWEEAFLDRAYQPDGSMVPRTEANALLADLNLVRSRLELLFENGIIEAADKSHLKMSAQTLCVHSDSPNAIEIAKLAAAMLDLKPVSQYPCREQIPKRAP